MWKHAGIKINRKYQILKLFDNATYYELLSCFTLSLQSIIVLKYHLYNRITQVDLCSRQLQLWGAFKELWTTNSIISISASSHEWYILLVTSYFLKFSWYNTRFVQDLQNLENWLICLKSGKTWKSQGFLFGFEKFRKKSGNFLLCQFLFIVHSLFKI